MNCSILISTYGDDAWKDLAASRALPSTVGQGAREVLVMHEPDATISEVRNANAARAHGRFLCHLDADDELAPGFLGAMRRALEQENRVGIRRRLLLTPAVTYVRKNSRTTPRHLDRGIPLTDDNWLVVGTLIERDFFLEIGGFGEYPHGFEDWSCWAKAWKAGAEIIKVRDAVYVAYWNQNSKHREGWRDRRWQVETHMRVRKDIFPELA